MRNLLISTIGERSNFELRIHGLLKFLAVNVAIVTAFSLRLLDKLVVLEHVNLILYGSAG